jgi:hypothetical protein
LLISGGAAILSYTSALLYATVSVIGTYAAVRVTRD